LCEISEDCTLGGLRYRTLTEKLLDFGVIDDLGVGDLTRALYGLAASKRGIGH
jgi:hypothetical protein